MVNLLALDDGSHLHFLLGILYNNMFSEGLQHSGHKIVDRGISMVKNYDGDKKLARRVVNVLFMVSNLSESDKLLLEEVEYLLHLLFQCKTRSRYILNQQRSNEVESCREEQLIAFGKVADHEEDVDNTACM